MKKFYKIKNNTKKDLFIGEYKLVKKDIINFPDELKSRDNFILLFTAFDNKEVELLDINEEILSKEKFLTIWNHLYLRYKNIIKYNDNTYKIYEFLSDDKLYNYNNYYITPKSIDYNKDLEIKLYKKETFNKGFLTKVEYFENDKCDNNILKVEIKYFINYKGTVSHRETVRSWAKRNGEYSDDVKSNIKHYGEISSKEEGVKRRNNIINKITIDIIDFVYKEKKNDKSYYEIETLIYSFLDMIDLEINKYIKGNLQPLIISINNADTKNHKWLLINTKDNITIHNFIETKLFEAILSEGELK